MTFLNFPSPHVSVHALAAAGFWFTGTADVVRCAFCSIEVSRWEEGDVPLEEHKRWSKNCRFARGFNVGNIPMRESHLSPLPPAGRDVKDTPTFPPSLVSLGVTRRYKPVHEEYILLASRLSSFEDWPCEEKVSGNALADAGFFYSGE